MILFLIKLSSYPHQVLLWAAATLVVRFPELIQQLLEATLQSRYSILLISVAPMRLEVTNFTH
jgi:hypothetical protein